MYIPVRLLVKPHVRLIAMRRFLEERLRLELKDEVTLIAPVTAGIPFLGFHIYPGVIRLNQRSLRRFCRQVHGREKAYQVSRLTAADLANSVTSLFAHMADADTLHLRRQLELSFNVPEDAPSKIPTSFHSARGEKPT